MMLMVCAIRSWILVKQNDWDSYLHSLSSGHSGLMVGLMKSFWMQQGAYYVDVRNTSRQGLPMFRESMELSLWI